MRPPPPHPHAHPALRVSAVSLAFRGHVLEVLVYPTLPLEELQRCIAAGFQLSSDGSSTNREASGRSGSDASGKAVGAPVAVKDPEHQVVYPLSFLTRSPELFEDGVYAVIFEGSESNGGDSSSNHTTAGAKAAAAKHGQQQHASRHRASKAHHRHTRRDRKLHRTTHQVSASLENHDSYDSDDSEARNDITTEHDFTNRHHRESIGNDAETEDDPDMDGRSEDEVEDDDEFMRELDLTDFELPQLVNVFTQACPTGALDRTTFDRCLEKILSQSGRYDPLARKMFVRLFEMFDRSAVSSGVIDVAEFLGGVSVLASGERDEKIRLTFELYDVDNDGFISIAEMVKYLTSVFRVIEETSPELFHQNSVNPQELGVVTARQCFKESPLNEEGKLSYDAFREWYSKPGPTQFMPQRPGLPAAFTQAQQQGPASAAPNGWSTASGPAGELTMAHLRELMGLSALRADDLFSIFSSAVVTQGANPSGNSDALTRDQFKRCFYAILKKQKRQPTREITRFLDRLFNAFDVDGNDAVDFVELSSGLSVLCGGTQEEKVVAAFSLFDANGDGFITAEEMQKYLTSVFNVMYEANGHTKQSIAIDAQLLAFYTTQQAFAEADLNHDGLLSLEEFRKWYSFSPTGMGLQSVPRPLAPAPQFSQPPKTIPVPTPTVAIGQSALASIDLVASITSLREREPSDMFEILAAKVNADGVLSRDAFHAVFEELADEQSALTKRVLTAQEASKTHAILDMVFNDFDTDKDGFVDFCELSSGISVFCKGSQHEKIKAAFSLFDVNQDGFISKEEMETYLASVFRIIFTTSPATAKQMGNVSPEQLAQATAADAFASADVNHDGRLSFDEFTKWYSAQHVLDFDALKQQKQQQHQAQSNGQAPAVNGQRNPTNVVAAKTTLKEMKTLTNLSSYDVNDIFDFFQASADEGGSLSQATFFRCFNKLLAKEGLVDRDTQAKTRRLLEELFVLFDADHNGTIDVQELGAGLSILCGGSLNDKARSLFRLYDLNQDGYISPEEMNSYLTGVFKVLYKASPHLESQTGMTPQQLAVATTQECFQAFDRNRDRQLSFEEFREWLDHQSPLSSLNNPSQEGPIGQRPLSPSAAAAQSALPTVVFSSTVIPIEAAKKLSGLKDIPLDKVTDLFSSAADKEGRISRKAFDSCFYRYLCSATQTQLTPEESNRVHEVIARLFTAFDTDQNGYVDFNELSSGLSVLCGGDSRDAKVQAAFDLYDTDGDGLISEDEMVHYLGSVFKLLYALDPTREQSLGISADDLAAVTAAEIFAESDLNHDGRLNFDEFKKWYALPEQSSFNAIVAPLDLDEVRRLTNLGNLDVVEVFERFAEYADEDGLLQREAFDKCFLEIIEMASHPRTDAEKLRATVVADRLFDVFDQDSNGQIDFSELASGLSVLCKGARDAKVKAAFRLYDFNGDGYISLEEMKRYLTSIFKVLYEVQPEMRQETGVSAEELGVVTAEQAFLEADQNHDGKLSYDEFLTWYTSPSQAGISSVVAKSAIVDSSLRWMPLNEIKQLTNLAQYEPDEVFEIFAAEADKDGLLSRSAFNSSFRRVMQGIGADDDAKKDLDALPVETKAKIREVVDGLFDLFDSDGSGYVDFGELASGLSVLCGGTKDQKVQAAFSLFDFNGDGFISMDEMTRYLTSVFRVLFQVSPDTKNLGVSPEELGQVTAEQAFAEADHDHDGKLTLEEFQQWYQQPGGIGEVAKNGEQLFSLAEARRLTNLESFSPMEVFEALADCADDQGYVSREAFDECFRKIISANQGIKAEEYEHINAILNRLFELFDVDKNGLVDFSEISSGLSVFCGGTSDDKVRAAFALYDYNGDGYISLEEMTRYLTSVFKVLKEASPNALQQLEHESAEDLGQRTAQQAFKEADLDQDGRLTFAEFRKWYTHSSAANIERLIQNNIPEWISLREVRRLTNLGMFTPTQVLESFRQFATRDGTLNEEGFRKAFAQFQGQHSDPESSDRLRLLVDRIFALFDTDKNGVVDFNELASGLSVLCGGSETDKVRAAFNLYDVNRDGYISLGEMRLYLTSVFKVLFEVDPESEDRMGVSAEELGAITAEQAFAEADLDKDGRLSFDEFSQWYAQSSSIVNQSHVPDWVSLQVVKEMTHLEKYAPDEVFEIFANRCSEDGTISREAFEECFEQLIDEQFKNDEQHLERLRLILDRLFTIFDTDGNGIVDFCELSSGLSVLCGGTREEKVRSAFALYDLNQDGFISLEEMAQYLTSVFKVLYETSPGTHAKLGVQPEELAVITAEQCFLEADLNHDGKLSFDEFVRWYSRSPGFEAPAAGVGGFLAEKRVQENAQATREGAGREGEDGDQRTSENGRRGKPLQKGTTSATKHAFESGGGLTAPPSSSGFPSSLLYNITSPGGEALLSPNSASALNMNSSNMDDARQLLKLDSYEVNDVFEIFAEAAPSGELSFAAFKKCFDQIIKLAGGHQTPEERQEAEMMIHRLFKVFDTNKSNTVDFGELASGLSVLSGSSMDEKVRAAFQLYDINGDGYITLDEMVSYMTSIFRVMYETSDATKTKMGVSAEELAKVTASQCFKEADLNNDSKLSFDEFKKVSTAHR
ncbi:Recoverin family protein [Globisporangium polare]